MGRVLADDVGRNERFEFAGRVKHFEHAVFGGDDMLNLPAEGWAIEVAEADGVRSADLVAVARTNAATRGADVLAVGRVFVERAILGKMPGKDDVRAIADAEIIGMSGAAATQFV